MVAKPSLARAEQRTVGEALVPPPSQAKVRGRRGDALVFYSVRPDGSAERYSQHEGMATRRRQGTASGGTVPVPLATCRYLAPGACAATRHSARRAQPAQLDIVYGRRRCDEGDCEQVVP